MRRIALVLLAAAAILNLYGQQQSKSKKDEAGSLFDYVQESSHNNASFAYAIIPEPLISAEDTTANKLAKALDEINEMPEIGFVIITGNITSDGKPESMEAVKTILKRLTKQYYILPGNLDFGWEEGGGTDFKRIFKAERFRLNFNGQLFVGFSTAMINSPEKGHSLPQNMLWVKKQLKDMGKKAPITIITNRPLIASEVDNWKTITDEVRHYNIQRFISCNNTSYQKEDYDGIEGVRIEALNNSYTVVKGKGDTSVIYRKAIGGELDSLDMFVSETKFYLEAAKNKDAKTKEKRTWTKQNQYAIYSQPAIGEKFCYFGDDNGTFYCLDMKKGKTKWKYQTSMRIIAQPVIANDKVVFGSCDHSIYCLNAETGAFLWRIRTEKAVIKSPVVEDGKVYLEKGDGTVYVIDLEKGEELRPETKELTRTDNSSAEVITTLDGEIYRK